MKAQAHHRPYNHAHAQAGAPIGLRNGAEVEIHHFGQSKVVGMHKGADGEWYGGDWGSAGEWITQQENRMDIVMLPLGTIEGMPVFVGDKIEAKLSGTICEASPQDRFNEPMAWGWPQPSPKYPAISSFKHAELFDIYAAKLHEYGYTSCEANTHGLLEIANAAIARAIEDGQVAPTNRTTKYNFGQVVVYETPGAEPVVILNECQYLPAEMLVKVARATKEWMIREIAALRRIDLQGIMSERDLSSIIASVKEGK